MRKLFSNRKRRKSLPVPTVCRNCGSNLQGAYCHQCGQNLFSGMKRTVSDLVFNALENMFSLDNKIFSTLKRLVFYPGYLTKEYMEGRIVRYVHPSKLFWFMTIVFFTLFFAHEKSESKGEDNAKNVAVSASLGEQDVRNDSARSDFNEEKKYDVAEAKFRTHFSTYSPYIMFMLIPLFALLIYIFFRRKTCFYADCMAFAMHFHSFVLLLFSIYIAIRMIWPGFNYDNTVFGVIPIAYLLRSVRVVFHTKMTTLVGKISVIILIYGIVICIVLIIFLIVVAIAAEVFNL